MKLHKNIIKIAGMLLVPIIFLVVSILTLKDYGFNWDEPLHFMRGQAYLHFLLTGEKDYSSLSAYPRLSDVCPDWAKGDCNISPGGATDVLRADKKGSTYEEATNIFQKGNKVKRSYYQHDIYTFNDFITLDEGHPPTGGILAALTNHIFYQRLKILGDTESHHLAEVLSAFLIVVAVAVLVYKKIGIFASFVSSLSLASYPLFFSESHFNIKDPMLASFFGLTIILLYSGIKKRKFLFILLSAIFLGLATGVKFNTFFLPFIVGPWLAFYFAKEFFGAKTRKKRINFIRNNILIGIAVILVPLLAFLVFYSLWPFLWNNPLANINKIISYYRQVGTGTPEGMASYIKQGWNTYPIIWIVYTTPIPILIFTFLGIIRSVFKFVKGNDFYLLVLLWFIVPILRVAWPNMVIYGGVRQIMEYIPPMAILAGIGAGWLVDFVKKVSGGKRPAVNFARMLVVASLLFVVLEMIKIHPNENVYFNQLIGGLSGARDKNIPSWGNTYGNVYLQGINWINKNVEVNAKLGLAVATMGNIPKLQLRTDIDFYNGNYSGFNRKGEYEIEMDFDWWPKKFYSFQYLDVYLEPVYVVKVDGVPLLKVWKNDLVHTKEGFKEERIYLVKSIDSSKNRLLIDIGREIFLTGVKIDHAASGCEPVKDGFVALSLDNVKWERELDPLVSQIPPLDKEFDKDTFIFLFPARKSRYILIDALVANSCLLVNPTIEIKGLKTLP